MIGKNYTYKDFVFDDNTSVDNYIVLQDVKKTTQLNTTIFNKQNYHGSILTQSLATGKLFTFTGQIFGLSKEERAIGQKRLNDIIKPEGIFGDNNGFYELSFTQDDGSIVKCNARVYSMPDYSTSIDENYIINFSFDLYSESPVLLSKDGKQTDQITSIIIGGNILPNLLPNKLDQYMIITYSQGAIYDIEGYQLVDVEGNEIMDLIQDPAGSFPSAENLGNFEGPCKIQLIGELENPKITNLTNNRFYALDGITTTNLILDNTGTEFIVTNEGVNIKNYRATGSKQMFLSPGVNNFVVTADNLSIDTTYQIKIDYNDYYINN